VDLPAGTPTVLFTDIEGSTRLIAELGEEGYVQALVEHRRLLRAAFAAHGGVEVDTQGDAFLYAFADPVEAVAAASGGQEALASGPLAVRMGLHTGDLQLTGEGYAGRELHRAARIAASGHGGQVVVSAATRGLIDGELIELGEHRLKDFDEPVALFQLGSQRFPPLKTISNTNLPRPVSSFVGRERERDELVSMLSDRTRLLTLTGPGGSGKTRLAIEAASELVPAFKAGVFWVGLSALRDPALVIQEIAQTVGAKDDLAASISERELLLLLDNFEQVVDAGPELSHLLEVCPNLSLLVTSRELLRIRGEIEYPVFPLAGPEAIELFCQRARLEPDETIAVLCRRLDDMPLALELAAARTRVLTPAQILDRLAQRLDLLKGGRDAGPRQRTLRATIEWSHDLLDRTEQQLFARLAVFAGGWILGAAEEVCDADLDTLQSLVDKSLLRHAGDRFWMLETIREYAVERLEHIPEADRTHERHAHWYTRFAEEGHAALRGPAQEGWLVRLDADAGNLRAAIGWARDRDERLEVRLAGATWFFLSVRGFLREALGDLLHALETAGRAPSLDQSELLYGAAYVAGRLGDYAGMERWGEQRLALGRARGDDPVIARSLLAVALAIQSQGDLERAQTLYREAAKVALGCGDTLTLALADNNLGNIALEEGDPEAARMHFKQSVELCRELSNTKDEANALVGMSVAALVEGNTEEATALLGNALRLASSLGDKEVISACLFACAEVAAQRGELARAARLLGAADVVREETALTLDTVEQALRARIETVLDREDQTLVSAQSQGRALTLEDAVAYALGQG
jgi:predicted ATPase